MKVEICRKDKTNVVLVCLNPQLPDKIRGMEGLNSTSRFLFTEFTASNFSATIVVPVMLTM